MLFIYKVLIIKLTPLKIKFKQLLIIMEWDGGGEGECAIQYLYHAVLEK